MASNIERFGKTLQNQIKNIGEAKREVISELGYINENYSLIPDRSPGPIPKGEYSLCRSARTLESGSRVLIIWCGMEPIVADVIN